MKAAVWLTLICASWLVVVGVYGLARNGWSAFAPHERQVLEASTYTGVDYPPADPRPRWPVRVAPAKLVTVAVTGKPVTAVKPAKLVTAAATTHLSVAPKAVPVRATAPRLCIAGGPGEKASCIEL